MFLRHLRAAPLRHQSHPALRATPARLRAHVRMHRAGVANRPPKRPRSRPCRAHALSRPPCRVLPVLVMMSVVHGRSARRLDERERENSSEREHRTNLFSHCEPSFLDVLLRTRRGDLGREVAPAPEALPGNGGLRGERAYCFVTVLPPEFVTQTPELDAAMPIGLRPTGNEPSCAPSLARSFVTLSPPLLTT